MARLPTVKIVHADGFAIINEADYDADWHELFAESDGTGTVLPPVSNEEREDGPVIPDGWRDLHWRSIVALANDIHGDPNVTITTKDDAIAVIEAEITRRADA